MQMTDAMKAGFFQPGTLTVWGDEISLSEENLTATFSQGLVYSRDSAPNRAELSLLYSACASGSNSHASHLRGDTYGLFCRYILGTRAFYC